MGGRQLLTVMLCFLFWTEYANISAYASWFGPRSLAECVEEKMEKLAKGNEDGPAIYLLTRVARGACRVSFPCPIGTELDGDYYCR
jgi:hypothetical protein